MKRYICALTIIIIMIFLGLYKMGIALFEYNGKRSGEFCAIIESSPQEKQYTKKYIVKIEKKKFILYVNKSNINFEIGDVVKFNGEFQEPEVARNEGGFNYKLYLKTKKIYGSFKSKKIKKVSKCKSIRILLKKKIEKIKEIICKALESNLKENNASLLKALIIGQKDSLNDNVIEDFKGASLSHILAISGAHFSYIMLMIYIFDKIIKRKRLAQILSIIFILFFIELTGASPSVLRAGIMGIILIISRIALRRVDIWTSISISALIQILYNPYVIFDLGFILSYAGVLGIIIFYDVLYKGIRLKSVAVTLSANVITMPITIYNFNTLSIVFVLSNVLVSIILGPIIILGFVSIIFKFKFFYIVLDVLLGILQSIAKIASNLPFSKILIQTPTKISIVIYFIFVYIMAIKSIEKIKTNKINLAFEKDNKKAKEFKLGKISKKIVAVFLILILLTNINFQKIKITISKELLINFVDVGQGDCTLIRTSDKTIMIDSGGSTDEKYDIGKTILLPYLLNKKITKLNYIMISHFDADHCERIYACP